MKQSVNSRVAWLALCALGASPWAAGCSDSSSVVAPPPPPDDVSDAGDVVGEVAMDVMDVPMGTDVPMDVMRRCMTNTDCAGNPMGAVCDTASGRCVGCVAMPDSCAGDQHCDVTSNTCVRGCHSDEGCAGAAMGDAGVGSDAGLGAGRCNTATNTCVQCVTNDHCPAGQSCQGNVCVIGCESSARCPTGQSCCAGGCVDTQTNSAHCMMCGRVCSVPNGSGSCIAGACAVGTCSDPFRDCDNMVDNGCETNTQSSLMNCGTCGRTCPTPAHATPTCAMGTCGFTCAAGFADCNEMASDGCEVDLGQDPAHCGACATMCATANGAPACTMGVCATGMCTPGFSDCDMNPTNGCETNTQTSTTACGMCGMACAPLANAMASCVMGRCALGACLTGFADCDGMPANGCETNLNSSATHCGRCGAACSVVGGAATCVMGRCGVGVCEAGLADCDSMVATGCETDTRTSTAHCGMCGNSCPVPANATAGCTGGVCGIGACAPGFADCNGSAGDGCEVELATNTTNCGRCGNACALANATAVCRGGACAVGTCNTGFADCDGNPANGCEVNTTNTLTSCGACGRVCIASNGVPVCRAGACAVASCDTGFADCNTLPADGCEVVTVTDTNNCGTCGTRCPTPPTGTAVCAAGVCGIGSCPTGFSDCNGRLDDGCEIASGRDTNNCGRCGTVCPTPPNGAAVCTSGVCGLGTCNDGFADCDSAPGNGCEVNVTTSLGNCGGCGRVCSPNNAAGVCTAGVCGILSCNDGFANCDGSAANGCETDIRTTTTSCGSCTTVCTAPTGGSVTCSARACVPTCPSGQTNCGGVCRATGGTCVSAGTGGCAQSGTVVCSGTTTACNVGPRTSGSCTAPTGGTCNSAGDCVCSGTTNCAGVCQTTGGTCTSAGTGGCAQTGTTVCSGTTTACSATPRTSGSCTSPTAGTCSATGTCACATGQTNCSGTCRDTLTDATACGASCGACTTPTGGSVACVGGVCVPTCPTGQTDCSGTCRATLTDSVNCGTCGNICTSAQACVNGACIGSGSLRITMTWTTAGDMDLHVLPPCGTEIYYGSRTNCGGTLDRDDTTGTGPENVNWVGTYTSGRYYVCAESFSGTVANTTYTVTVVVNGSTVHTVTGTRGGVTDGNRACGAGFNTFFIDL